jgi:hypothetical protein
LPHDANGEGRPTGTIRPDHNSHEMVVRIDVVKRKTEDLSDEKSRRILATIYQWLGVSESR